MVTVKIHLVNVRQMGDYESGRIQGKLLIE